MSFYSIKQRQNIDPIYVNAKRNINKVKMVLYQTLSRPNNTKKRLIDFSSGVGGDTFKYKFYSSVLALDIAENSKYESHYRRSQIEGKNNKSQITTKIEFIQADTSKDLTKSDAYPIKGEFDGFISKIMEKKVKFDVATSNMSLTHYMSPMTKLQQLIDNMSVFLKQNGMVFVTSFSMKPILNLISWDYMPSNTVFIKVGDPQSWLFKIKVDDIKDKDIDKLSSVHVSSYFEWINGIDGKPFDEDIPNMDIVSRQFEENKYTRVKLSTVFKNYKGDSPFMGDIYNSLKESNNYGEMAKMSQTALRYMNLVEVHIYKKGPERPL